MKAYICFVVLIACALCASKKSEKKLDPTVKNEIKEKMIECISQSTEISQILKDHLEKVKKADERIPLHFSKVDLEDKDREVIKACKRQVFKERRKKEKENAFL